MKMFYILLLVFFSIVAVCYSNTITATATDTWFVDDGGLTLPGEVIIGFEIDETKTQFAISYRQARSFTYPEGGDPPDRVWKEVYGFVDGKIALIKTIEGKHTPAKWEPESIQFPIDGE